MAELNTNTHLDAGSLARMREIVNGKELRPRGTGTQTDRQHVEHCFHQMVRFANLAARGSEFRALQFGLNMGRAQEILESNGGVNCWWRLYEPLIADKKYDDVVKVTLRYIDALGLTRPTSEFIHKM